MDTEPAEPNVKKPETVVQDVDGSVHKVEKWYKTGTGYALLLEDGRRIRAYAEPDGTLQALPTLTGKFAKVSGNPGGSVSSSQGARQGGCVSQSGTTSASSSHRGQRKRANDAPIDQQRKRQSPEQAGQQEGGAEANSGDVGAPKLGNQSPADHQLQQSPGSSASEVHGPSQVQCPAVHDQERCKNKVLFGEAHCGSPACDKALENLADAWKKAQATKAAAAGLQHTTPAQRIAALVRQTATDKTALPIAAAECKHFVALAREVNRVRVTTEVDKSKAEHQEVWENLGLARKTPETPKTPKQPQVQPQPQQSQPQQQQQQPDLGATSATDQVKWLSDRVAHLTAALDTANKEKEEQVQLNTANTERFEARIRALCGKREELRQEVVGLQGKVENLEEQLKQANADRDHAQAEGSVAANEYAVIVASEKELEAKVKKLTADKERLEAEVEKLKADKERLEAEVEKLKAESSSDSGSNDSGSSEGEEENGEGEEENGESSDSGSSDSDRRDSEGEEEVEEVMAQLAHASLAPRTTMRTPWEGLAKSCIAFVDACGAESAQADEVRANCQRMLASWGVFESDVGYDSMMGSQPRAA